MSRVGDQLVDDGHAEYVEGLRACSDDLSKWLADASSEASTTTDRVRELLMELHRTGCGDEADLPPQDASDLRCHVESAGRKLRAAVQIAEAWSRRLDKLEA